MSTYLEAGDVRQRGDLWKLRGSTGIEAWQWDMYPGDRVTEYSLQTHVFMRPDAEWLALWEPKLPPKPVKEWEYREKRIVPGQHYKFAAENIVQQMKDALTAGDTLFRHCVPERTDVATEAVGYALNRLWAYYVMSSTKEWAELGPERATLSATALWNEVATATCGRFLCTHGPSVNADGYPVDCDIVWCPAFCAVDIVIRLRPETVWPGHVKRPGALIGCMKVQSSGTVTGTP